MKLVLLSVLVVEIVDPIEECRLLGVWTAKVKCLGFIVSYRISLWIIEGARASEIVVGKRISDRFGPVCKFVPKGLGLLQEVLVFGLQVLRECIRDITKVEILRRLSLTTHLVSIVETAMKFESLY